jgi:hypothetical protein
LTAFGIDGFDGVREPGETVRADEQDVAHSAVLEVGQDAGPEPGAFGALDPQPEAVALALEGDPDGHLHRLSADDLGLADGDHHGVQIDDHVDLFQRPRLPPPNVVGDRGGDVTD